MVMFVSACRTSADPVRPKAKPSALPSAEVSLPSAAPPVVAQAPPDSVKLTGHVAIDAGYVISNNGGSIVSNNGGSVLAVGGALVSNNAGNFRLLEAAPTVLPAYGMAVEAFALPDLRPLTVAADQGGKALTAVTSERDGAFTIYVPAALANKLVISGRVPGSSDPRAQVKLLTDVATNGDRALDEDSTLISNYLMEGFVSRVREIITTDDPQRVVESLTLSALSPPVKLALAAVVKEMNQAGLEAGLRTAKPEATLKLARAATLTVVDHLKFDQIMITPAVQANWPFPDAPALPTIVTAMRKTREGAAAKLAADPAYFERQPYFQAANAGKPAGSAYRILKAADLVDFVAREYLYQTISDPGFKMDTALTSVGLPITFDVPADDQADYLLYGANALFVAFGQALVLDQDGAKSEVLAQIKAFR
ncbi:MAG: hypothetical protein JWM80_162 [Cyanobacteria bacterium RYN_339]|nr:hypothetical protein [Cyanobacteria bacterium RYN_339]